MQKEGNILQIKKLISYEMVKSFAEISGDLNPIHIDKEFGKNSKFGNNISHGVLGIGFISAGLTELFGEGNLLISINSKFINPIIVDTEIEITLTIKKIDTRFNKATVIFFGKSNSKILFKGNAECIYK